MNDLISLKFSLSKYKSKAKKSLKMVFNLLSIVLTHFMRPLLNLSSFLEVYTIVLFKIVLKNRTMSSYFRSSDIKRQNYDVN